MTRAGTAPVCVINISATGASLSGAGAESFTWCVLLWMDQEFYGEMVWSDRAACGIQFEVPLPTEVILAIKQRFPAIAESARLPLSDRMRTI